VEAAVIPAGFAAVAPRRTMRGAMSSLLRPAPLVLLAGALALAAGAWRASSSGEGGAPAVADARAASEAVVRYLQLAAHLQRSGGDERFAERLPATREAIADLLAEGDAQARAGRSERARLVRADVRGVTRRAPDAVEVSTREYWITQGGGAGSGPERPRSDVVEARYAVVRAPGGWRVAGWRLDLDAPPEAPRP
jgi:hypothetical protein